jgi:hypothetical protein
VGLYKLTHSARKRLVSNLENRKCDGLEREKSPHTIVVYILVSKFASVQMQLVPLHDGLNEKVQKLHRDLEEQIHTNTQLLAENSQKQVELKVGLYKLNPVRRRRRRRGRRRRRLYKLNALSP